jgi:hypothetical protein
MSLIKTNAIQTTGGKPILNSTGGILQVVQVVKTDTFSTSGFSWTDVTGLSVTITPSSASSKIMVLLDTKVGSNNDYGVNLRLVRGSTPIYLGDLNGNRVQVSSWVTTYGNANTTQGYNMTSVSLNYLDSPSTTSATTYKIQLSSYSGTGPAYINRTHQWQQGGALGYDGCPPSSITVMEVSA